VPTNKCALNSSSSASSLVIVLNFSFLIFRAVISFDVFPLVDNNHNTALIPSLQAPQPWLVPSSAYLTKLSHLPLSFARKSPSRPLLFLSSPHGLERRDCCLNRFPLLSSLLSACKIHSTFLSINFEFPPFVFLIHFHKSYSSIFPIPRILFLVNCTHAVSFIPAWLS
jgi:hypothetical protein